MRAVLFLPWRLPLCGTSSIDETSPSSYWLEEFYILARGGYFCCFVMRTSGT